ncbi:MAG: long-chain fatty acid--CoA ligase [Candidatus Eremiobacteraeota bacterium]|nr:long-chain fatty acid--CoA ligase [Candidatus Eremiobacteraeota bacterium]
MTLSLASILAESALRYPERTGLVLGSERINYGDLWQQTRRFASVLSERGIAPGDKVALMIPNSLDFPRAYYGVATLGAVVVPMHPLLVADEVRHVLADAGVKLLVCAGSLVEGRKGADRCGVEVLDVEALRLSSETREPVATYVQRDASDDAVILYTSGTTGKPKGAVLSQLNLIANASTAANDLFRIVPDDVILGCLPLFHAFGQTVVMNAGFRAGASVVLMPRFTGETALDVSVTERATMFAGVPTMYVALLEAAKSDQRRPKLRVAASGGSALLLAVLEEFERVFEVPIYEGYGLSETSPVATFNQDCFGRKPGTVGCGIWGVDVRIAKADIEDRIEFVPLGDIGEVVIRGHCVFKGYLNQPEATRKAIVDGWFRSGDLGTQDGDGFITIVDRKKDMVLRGGFNVYPREVEEVLIRHPAVGAVAVIGVVHPVHGEEVVAVVVRDPRATEISGNELIAWSKEQLARYKYPRVVHFVESLPLGPTGKVLKRELVGRFSTTI